MSANNTDAPELIHAVPVKHWGRWISAIVVAILAAMIAHGLIYNEQFHWDIVFANFFKPNVLDAVGWTLILTVAAMVIGIVLAVTLAVASLERGEADDPGAAGLHGAAGERDRGGE